MNRSRQEIEALADIFLGPEPSGADARSGDSVVCLLEGHLPVRNDVWRTAAARLIAANEPATLLETNDHETIITPLHGHEVSAPRHVEELIACPAAGHTWLVTGSSPTPTSGVAMDRWVLLTGADQAAMVAAYRLVKGVCQGMAATPSFEVIIAGSPRAVAEEVFGRLQHSLQVHLSMASELIGVIPTAPPVDSAPTFKLPAMDGGMSALIETLHARTIARPALPVTESPQIKAPSVPSGHERPRHLDVIDVGVPLPDGIELAVDAARRLHVIAQECAAASLISTQHWAQAHLVLMAETHSVDSGEVVQGILLVEDIHRSVALASGPWTVYLKTGEGWMEVPPPASGTLPPPP